MKLNLILGLLIIFSYFNVYPNDLTTDTINNSQEIYSDLDDNSEVYLQEQTDCNVEGSRQILTNIKSRINNSSTMVLLTVLSMVLIPNNTVKEFGKKHSNILSILGAISFSHKILPASINQKIINYFIKQSDESFNCGTANNSEFQDLANTINMLYVFGGGAQFDGIKKATLINLSIKALTACVVYKLFKYKLQ